jgi:hypothetical protein
MSKTIEQLEAEATELCKKAQAAHDAWKATEGAKNMTDFHTLLRATGVSRPWLAENCGRSRSLVDHWCDGKTQAPAEIVAWLQRRIDDPPPFLASRQSHS